MQEGLKILNTEITNFKNIKHKIIEFDGRSVMVVGKNGAGKSSLIQAITSPINSKMLPSKPITEGEETASVLMRVGGMLNGERHDYNIDMFFSEKNSKGKLVITDEDGGAIPGGKSMVNSIVGNVGFDILEFISLGLTKDGKPSKPGIKEQIEILKAFIPIEAQKLLMGLDTEKKEVYDERAEVNRELKSNEAKLKDAQMDPELIEKYSEKKDDADVKARMSKIGNDMSTYDKVAAGVKEKEDSIEASEKDIEDLDKEIETKRKELSQTKTEIIAGNGWLKKKGDRPSMEALNTEIEEIDAHNKEYDKVVSLKGFSKNSLTLTEKSDAKTERLTKIEEEKKKIFTDNPLPVKGLVFTEDEIYYNNLPFNENQHPSSTIIGVGLKIAMGINPNLKLLIIKDGSLLDKKTLNYILQLVEKKGYQVFVEMVDVEGEKDVEIQFIESEA